MRGETVFAPLIGRLERVTRGLGAQPPVPSWGRMLAESQTLIPLAPHVALFPKLAIVASVLGLNPLGDAPRDWLDPRLRRAR